ncbi:DUF2510 domain-containing protein [Schumannella soli]|uniref:DUF2510 domain-containing protein n=1 Tax=Schumannella soli TaxID=2590779 RepID=A0A506Y6M9_9MICO|nr:DUF2510 domain-containing protein [Schumannella soli]TPW76059.1 DUF2510 domain-containing protein [Schumannella soli]
MTDVASARPRAGWYDDPTDAAGLRWWDGIVWTDNAMPKPAGAPVSVPPPLGSAYSVDDQRASASPRRAARLAAREAARREPDADALARVTPLRPTGDDLPPLALVPEQVSAPEPVPVAVDPAAAVDGLGALPSFDDFLSAALPETAAGSAAPAANAIPQPGELVGGPVPGTAILDAAATALPEPAELTIAPAEAPAVPAAPSVSSTPSTPAAEAPASAVPATLPAPEARSAAAAPLPVPAPRPDAMPAPAVAAAAGPIVGREVALATPTPRPVLRPTPATASPALTPSPGDPAHPAAFVPDFAPDGRPVEPAPGRRLPVMPAAVAPTAPSAAPSRHADDWWRGLMPVGSVTTASVLLALAPVFTTVLPLAALAFAVQLPDFALLLLALPVALVIPPVALALVDRGRLRGMGWGAQASPAWVVLSPLVYLLARQFVLRRQGARTRAFTITTLLMPVVAVGVTGALLAVYQHDILVWLLVLQVRLA